MSGWRMAVVWCLVAVPTVPIVLAQTNIEMLEHDLEAVRNDLGAAERKIRAQRLQRDQLVQQLADSAVQGQGTLGDNPFHAAVYIGRGNVQE